MAEEVAAGYVSLYARMEGSQVASEISSVLEGAASTAAGAFTGFGDIVSGIGRDLSLMSVGADMLLTKAGKGVMNTIAMGESAAITFGTMGRAMGEASTFADDFMEKLNRFSVKTPFEFENTAAAVKQLLAMGFTANEVLDDTNRGILVSAGNAASALGLTDQGLSNILLQFGHIKSMGKTMSYQMNALARNGLPAWKMLADYMKMSVEEVRAAVRAGEVDADTTIAALMQGMEQYSGQMERMSHTFMGIVSNFADAMKIPIQELRNGEGYKAFTESLYNLTDPLEDLVRAFAPVLNSMFAQLAPVIDAVQEKVKQLTDWLHNQDPDALARVFRNAVAVLNSGPLLMLLGRGSGAIGGAIGGIGEIMSSQFSAASVGVTSLQTAFAGLRESLTVAKPAIQETKAGFSLIKDEARLAGDMASKHLGWHITHLGQTATSSFYSMGTKIRLVRSELGMMKAFMPTIKKDFASATGYMIGTFKVMGKDMVKPLLTSLSALTPVAKALGSAFGAFSTKMLGVSTVIALVSAAAVTATAAFNSMGVNVSALVDNALNSLEQMVASLPEAMSSFGSMFENLLSSGQLEAIGTALTERLPEILNNAITSVFAGLDNAAIGDAFRQMVDIIAETIAVNGPIILDGLLQAISMAFQGIAEAIPIVAAHIPEFMAGVGNAIIENAPVILESFIQALAGLGVAFDVFLEQLSHNLGEASVGKELTTIDTSVEDLQRTVDGLNTQPFVDMATAVGQLAAAIGSIVVGVIEGIVDALNSPEAQVIAADIASAISGIADGLKRVVDTGAARDFGELLATLGGELAKTAVDTVRALTTLVGDLAGTYQNLKLVMENGVDFSSWKLEDQVIYINNVYQNLLHLQEGNSLVFGEGTSMADGYLESVRGISPELDNFIDHLKNTQGTQDLVKQETDALGDGMDIMRERLENGAGAADTLNGALSDVKFDDVARKASGMADGVEGSFRRAINSSSGFGGQISANVSSASGSFSRIVSDAGVMAGNLGTEFTKAGNAGNNVPPPIDKAMILAMKHVSKLVSGVKGGRDDIIDYAGAMAVAFDILWSVDLYSAGQAIMNSFLAGLQSMWGAIQAFINMIGPWIHGAKGPLDYDRRLLIPAGRAIMGGLYKGLKTGFTTEVMPLVTTMADTIDQAFDSMTMPTPSMAGVSLGNMSAGDVRGPVVMQPTFNVYDVDNPEAFARESVTYMNQLIESEGRNG